MANLFNTIKKAEKLSGTKHTKDGQFYSVKYKGWNIQFACNGRLEPTSEATNYYTKKNGSIEDDTRSDYFGGTFHDNISQCFKFIDRNSIN